MSINGDFDKNQIKNKQEKVYWTQAEIAELIKQKLIYYNTNKSYRKDRWKHFKRELPKNSIIAKFNNEQMRSKWRKIAIKTFLEKNANLFTDDAEKMVLVISL